MTICCVSFKNLIVGIATSRTLHFNLTCSYTSRICFIVSFSIGMFCLFNNNKTNFTLLTMLVSINFFKCNTSCIMIELVNLVFLSSSTIITFVIAYTIFCACSRSFCRLEFPIMVCYCIKSITVCTLLTVCTIALVCNFCSKLMRNFVKFTFTYSTAILALENSFAFFCACSRFNFFKYFILMFSYT